MGISKFDVEKFNGKNDFGLWRIKIRALLVQQDLYDALLGEKNMSSLSNKEKSEILQKKAHNTLILFLGDKVLREVTKEDTTVEVWLKLESLYMTKSLENRFHKKIKLCTFKMTPGISIEEHLDELNKIILDLTNIDIKIDDEDQAILLLSSLDNSYAYLKKTMMYGRERLTLDEVTLDEVQSILHSRELQNKVDIKTETGKGLTIRGR